MFICKTLDLDEVRYNQVHVATMRLLLISTIMTVLSHLTGSILRDYEAIKTLLKSEMIILLDDFPEKKFVFIFLIFYIYLFLIEN